MSGTELLVIVFGLFIGYWVVFKFGHNNNLKNEQGETQSSSEAQAQHSREQAERDDKERRRQNQQQHAEEPRQLSWHEILNVSPSADTQEIRRAYKSLMSQYHPDKVASLGSELKELCERKTKEINTAYDRAIAERGTA